MQLLIKKKIKNNNLHYFTTRTFSPSLDIFGILTGLLKNIYKKIKSAAAAVDVLQTLTLKRVLEVCSPLSLSMSDTKPNCIKRNGAAVASYFHFAKSFFTCWEKIQNMVNK